MEDFEAGGVVLKRMKENEVAVVAWTMGGLQRSGGISNYVFTRLQFFEKRERRERKGGAIKPSSTLSAFSPSSARRSGAAALQMSLISRFK
jgi:hypothetical protein